MKTKKQTITIEAANRAELENKIVNHFSLGYKAVTEVTQAENGNFQIKLTK